MQEFGERVAVVTGAASGIRRALADRCAASWSGATPERDLSAEMRQR